MSPRRALLAPLPTPCPSRVLTPTHAWLRSDGSYCSTARPSDNEPAPHLGIAAPFPPHNAGHVRIQSSGNMPPSADIGDLDFQAPEQWLSSKSRSRRQSNFADN